MSRVDKSDLEYIGDSVYVSELVDGSIVLQTRNGLPDDPSNEIILNHSVLQNLEMYLDCNLTGKGD